MKTITLLAGLVAMGSAYGQSTRNFDGVKPLSEGAIKDYYSNIQVAQNPSSERATLCGDTTYYPMLKGSAAAEFPLVTDGVSFEALSQTYYNTSNITVTGVRIWLSNPGDFAVDATVHLYRTGSDNAPSERLAWADASVQPGMYQSADFYFNDGVSVSSNFSIAIQALPNGLSDTVAVAYNAQGSGRGENLLQAGWHDGTSLGSWLSGLNTLGLDADFMIFPIYEYELTSDLTFPSTVYVDEEFTVNVDANYIATTDSMINFSYYFASQLYVDFYDENGILEFQTYNDEAPVYSHDAAGVYDIGVANVWFKWTTIFLNPNDPNFVPYYCFDETVQQITVEEQLTTNVKEENNASAYFNENSLYLNGVENIQMVSLYSLSGQFLSAYSPAGKMDMSDLSEGIYLAEITMIDGTSTTLKLVK